MSKILKIGIVGCGAIGSRIALAIAGDFKKNAKLVAVSDISADNVEKLRKKLKKKIPNISAKKLIMKTDLVVEAASKEISAKVADMAVSKGRDILIMSVGGLLGREKILAKARKKKVNVYLPSGAICGLDGLKAVALSKIKKVILTTRKPPKSLPLRFHGINKETLIFSGSAKEAVKRFPQNINVAATLSLVGLGARKTQVRIIASPKYKKNIHEVIVESSAGKMLARTENVPTPGNAKTSYLAVLSAIRTLTQIFDSVKIGT